MAAVMRKLFHILAGVIVGGILLISVPAFTTPAAAADNPAILVPASQGPSVQDQLMTRAKSSWPWYITRGSGLVAAGALIILMLSGVGFVTGRSFSFLEPLTAWATHRALGIIFAIAIAIHGIALLFDTFIPFNISEVLLPFLSHYRTVSLFGISLGSLYVALGIIAMYLIAAMVISTYLWIDKKPRIWKAVHFMAYLVMIFVFIHALYLGTDLAEGPLRIAWIVLGIAAGLAMIVRMGRRARLKK